MTENVSYDRSDDVTISQDVRTSSSVARDRIWSEEELKIRLEVRSCNKGFSPFVIFCSKRVTEGGEGIFVWERIGGLVPLN